MLKMPWFIYGLIGTTALAAMVLIFKYLGLQGLSQQKILFYVFLVGTIFYLTHLFITKTSLVISGELLWWLIAAAFFSYLGNLLIVKSVISAPNPGYADAVSAFRIVLTTIAATLLFGSELTLLKGTGVVVMVLGLILLSI